jgi:hypothetical protein
MESLVTLTGGVWDKSKKYSSVGHIATNGLFISVKAKKAGAVGASVPIKPSNLGLTGRRMTPAEYMAQTLKALDNAAMDGGLRVYLIGLFRYYAGVGDEITVRLLHKLHKARIPVREVTNYFGEVMGPLAITHLGMLPLGTYVIEHPIAANQPLMDYALHEPDKTWVVSAKAAKTTTTNTIKPKDVLTLLGESEKWKNTLEYQILETLVQYNTLLGPIAAYRLIFPGALPQSVFDEILAHPAATAPLPDDLQLELLPGLSVAERTVESLMLACERFFKRETRNGELNYTDLFADAIEGKVVYVKFALNNNGFGTWGLITPADVRARAKRVILRSKNSVGRASDKMGLQV